MRRAEELDRAGIEAWVLGAAERWPEVFDAGQLQLRFAEADARARDRRELVGLLRADLLRRVWFAAKDCARCELARNRLAGRPVLDDGNPFNDPWELKDFHPLAPLHAEIMLVGEGPGQYEQRTGQPLVSYHVLNGSFCANRCTGYEDCYGPDGRPRKACDIDAKGEDGRVRPDVSQGLLRVLFQKTAPDALREERLAEARRGAQLVQIERTKRQYVPLKSAGQLLDDILLGSEKLKGWARRESWNSRRLHMEPPREPKPGSLYITNAVKCRSAQPNPEREGRLKDCAPTPEQVESCRRFLEMQLYLVQPKVIVALGAPAAKLLTGKKDVTIKEERGKLQQALCGTALLIEYHPAWALHAEAAGRSSAIEDYKRWLPETLEKARQIAAGEIELPWAAPVAAAPIALPPVPGAPVFDPADTPLAAKFPADSYPPDYGGERMPDPAFWAEEDARAAGEFPAEPVP